MNCPKIFSKINMNFLVHIYIHIYIYGLEMFEQNTMHIHSHRRKFSNMVVYRRRAWYIKIVINMYLSRPINMEPKNSYSNSQIFCKTKTHSVWFTVYLKEKIKQQYQACQISFRKIKYSEKPAEWFLPSFQQPISCHYNSFCYQGWATQGSN